MLKVTLLKPRPVTLATTRTNISYPTQNTLARATFISDAGKPVTAHQWAVYDFIKKIPSGRVMTYKEVSTALGSGSARSVGSALRNNPFAPYIPCHRVIASDHFVGGFFGEWGVKGKDGGKMQEKKLSLLREEGVHFDTKGVLIDRGLVWDGKSV